MSGRAARGAALSQRIYCAGRNGAHICAAVEVVVPDPRAAARRLGAGRARRDRGRTVREASARGAIAQSGDERVSMRCCPGSPTCTVTDFSAAWRGSPNIAAPRPTTSGAGASSCTASSARMTPDDLEAVTAQAYVEMLEGGFTRVGEFHYVHHDASGQAVRESGRDGGTRGRGGRDAPASDSRCCRCSTRTAILAVRRRRRPEPLHHRRRRLRTIVRGQRGGSLRCVARRHRRRGAAFSLRAVTPDELAQVVALAASGPMHIHAAEQTGEVEQCLAWSGARPVQWLLDNAAVDARWCLVHCHAH